MKPSVSLGLPAHGGRVDADGEAGDGAFGAQPVHAPLDGGGGEPDLGADVRVGAAGVFGEGVHDAFVEIVQSHGG